MQNGAPFFNRVGHIEIVKSDDETEILDTRSMVKASVLSGVLSSISNINFKFKIHKLFQGNTKGTATVQILGLSRETVNYLSTYLSAESNINDKKRIRVYAGYESTGERLILDGDILYAHPSIPPENWLTIEAQCTRYRNTKMFSESMRRFTSESGRDGYLVKQIIEKAAKWLELDVVYVYKNYSSDLLLVVQQFDVTGTKADIIAELNNLCNLKCWEDGGVLYVGDRDPSAVPRNNTRVISKDTGMIGVPRFQYPNASVKTLLRTDVSIYDYVQIDSIMIPGASGRYKVNDIVYEGEFRGQPWYSTFNCIREDMT